MTDAPAWAETEYAEDVQSDGPGVLDYFWAVLLGLGTVALLTVWAYPMLHPSAWADVAAGAGIRPPEHIFHGSARLWASLSFHFLRPSHAIIALTLLARIMAGATVFFIYLLFSDILRLIFRSTLRNRIWEGRVKRMIPALGALLFACSDALWLVGQALTADTFLAFGTIVLLWLFFRFLCTGRLSMFYWCLFIAGMMCAESPAGFVWAVFLGVASLVALQKLGDMNLPFFDPFVMQLSKWRMSFFLFQGFALGVTLNLTSFFILGGWKASGWNAADLMIKSVVHYGKIFASAASPVGWILVVVFALLPLIGAVVLFRGATDEDNFLPYRSGLAFLLIGFVAFSQLCALKPLWFWTWSESGELVGSLYLRGVCALASSLALTLSLTVLGVAIYVRNNHRIMRQRFPEYLESPAEVARVAAQRRAVRFVRRFGALAMLALLLAASLPGRRQATLRGLMEVLRDFVRETVAEAGDAKWLFTDGAFDAAVELRSFVEGGELKTISMHSSQTPYDEFLRTRGVPEDDEENRRVLENGTMDAVRTWICDRPEGAVKFAAQIGIEFWKRAKKPMPPPAGVLVRPGMAAAEAEQSGKAADALAERLLSFKKAGLRQKVADFKVLELVDSAQWRLSRMLRLRAAAQDGAGNPNAADEDIKRADRLDKSNRSLVKLIEALNRKSRESGPQLTPREGLKLALNRADFALAARYAIPILNGDPSNAEANFGMGMNFLVEKQYFRAAEHLRRVVAVRPKEPAALNNLALCLMHLNEFDAAETNAAMALKLMPTSAEIKETLELISKARAAAKGARR